ncbi:MAG: TraB domain-containing protein [Candidatus Heimdallarchaeota archaeon]
MTKVTLVGITHIDAESPVKVKRIIEELKPDAVCLELDEFRLNKLLEQSQVLQHEYTDHTQPSQLTLSDELPTSIQETLHFEVDFLEDLPTILEDIGFFEGELAKIANVDFPGLEMLLAYQTAKKLGSNIYLIDKSIHDISQAMALEISEEESLKFQDLIDELILDKKIVVKKTSDSNETAEEHLKEEEMLKLNDEEINLTDVFTLFQNQDSLKSILEIFRSHFPNLYSILLEDRDVYMTKEILKVALNHSNIVVVIGYGHIKAISELLQQHAKGLEIVISK